jgi:predicted nuclease with TOPRIM domain
MDFVRLIQEGRVDDFKSKYSQKFGNNVNNIVSKVPHKFLDWVGKNLDTINFEENLEKLSQALNKFEKISSNLPITDLYQYKSAGQLLSALSEYEQRLRRKVKPVNGGNVVYDDGRYFIVNPLTLDSSCYYGRGTKWCTSATNNTKFADYNQDGKLFYIMDRTLPTSDPYYKVALLKKFDGDKTFYDAKDDIIRSGWLWNTNKLKEILDVVDDYMNKEYPEQIKIYSDKEAAKKEKERLERVRIQRILQGQRNEAEERRLDGEWELGPDCPEEGLKAHALLDWLVDTSDVEVITDEDRIEIERIKNEIERLQAEYDNDEDVRQDLLDEISDLEDELSELEDKIDVYNIIPYGEFYHTTQFIVIDAGLTDREYAVGTESEMESSAYDSVDSLLDDIGYENYNESFVMGHIDTDEVVDYFREFFEDDAANEPSAYVDEEDKILSDEQEEQIRFLKEKIEVFETKIERLEYELGGEDDDEIQSDIDEINEEIEELNDEISDIESSPEDYPEDKIEEAVEDRLEDVRRNPESYIKDWGLDHENFIDRRAFIQDVIDTDGYANTLNSYDGNADEQKVQDQWFYVMRIN